MKTKRSLRREAARWLFELETSQCPGDVWTRLQAWLVEDERHRRAWRYVERGWRGATILSAALSETESTRLLEAGRLLKAAEHCGRLPETSRWRGVTQLRTRQLGLATLVIVVGAGLVWWNYFRWASLQTGYGERRSFVLADGSHVTLNSNSRLNVRLTANSRDLELLDGELLIDAKADTQRPLDVRVNGTLLRAIGTQFCVLRVSNENFEAVVIDGRVKMAATVAALDAPVPVTPVSQQEAGAKILQAGQMAVVTINGTRTENLDQAGLQKHLLWREGKVSLAGMTLEEAVEEFNRYNARKLKIGTDDIRSLKVGGIYDLGNPDGFAEAMQQLFHIQYKAVGLKGSSSGVITLKGSLR